MSNPLLRARILAAIGVGGVASAALLSACGSESVDPKSASGDASVETSTTLEAAADVQADATADVRTDASSSGDADPDALPSIRRPFLVGTALRSAPGVEREDWLQQAPVAPPSPDLDPDTAMRLARAWQDDALQEHASIAAFARFSMMLLGVAAPPDLVVASQRASIEEVAHSRACFALARRYGATEAGPGPLEVHDALGRFTLEDVAALTAEEGCVGETLGVVLASEQLARATDPVVRNLLERIVADETRHAELAWRFVAWAIARDPSVLPAVLARIDRAVATTLAMEVRPPVGDLAAWAAHGRLTCAEAREASARAIRDIVTPARAALAGRAREVVRESYLT
jgi:hypothetical protein